MGKKNKARRRRQRFISLDTRGVSDADAITATSGAAHVQSAKRARAALRVDEAPAVLAALRAAEETSEVYLDGLPSDTGPGQVANALRRNLHLLGVGKGVAGCVVRVTVKAAGGGGSHAWALLWAREAADVLVGAPPLDLCGVSVKVRQSDRSSLPGQGGWGSRMEPGAKRFPVGLVEVGELKRAEGRFSAFWKSERVFNLEKDYVEVNPVSRVVAITLGRERSMVCGDERRGTFESFKSLFRIEVPFHYVVACRWQKLDQRAGHTALYFRVAHPPRLYRQAEKSGMANSDRAEAVIRAQRDRTWDFEHGETANVLWRRTIDPTETAAFSRTSGIRIFLPTLHSLNFLNCLSAMCLIDHVPMGPAIVTSELETRHVDLNAILADKARDVYGIPFTVRYEIECLVGSGALLPSDLEVNEEFWMTLRCLGEDRARNVLDLVHVFSQTEEGYTLLNPVEALEDAMHVIKRRPTAGSDVAVAVANGVKRKPGGGSVDPVNASNGENQVNLGEGGGDDDEFLVETFERTLNLYDDAPEPGDAENLFTQPLSQRSTAVMNRAERAGIPAALSAAENREGEKDEEDAAALGPPVRMSKAESHQALFRRVRLTPTRVVACRPDSDLLNRVLREFEEHNHRFIRAGFQDEDGSSIAYGGSSDTLARIRQLLGEGVEVAGERFVFLAFSSSQLRDHGCWMYNEEASVLDKKPPPTANAIREWMGDFSMITTASKYAARMGQAFSSTVGTVSLDERQQGELEDIWDDGKNYCFSDGCGIISCELGRYVSKKLRLRFKGRIPSAFQIRYAGAKGMLSCWDTMLPRGGGTELMLRPSMIKFRSDHKAVEIVGYSKRLPLLLNRQLILTLGGLGISGTVFLNLQKRVLRSLDAVMRADGAVDALNLLYTAGCGSSDSRLKSLSPMLDAASMFRAGLTATNCEFLFLMMTAFRRRVLDELTHRARIPIGLNDGCSAIGVLDEAAVLGPGEIFLQYAHPVTGDVLVVRGPVVVGRSPTLHPGDMQPLIAVYREELAHLVDVIVFPQMGDRPIPSMLSGGDLDGDQFAIIWASNLVPARRGHPAMNYTARAKPASLGRHVQITDIMNFFVSYIENDCLGRIAVAHLVHADKQEQGIFSKQCLQLAELHSTAVDFAKSGIPAVIPQGILPRNIPEQFPDYMEKHPKVSYRSLSVLGKLYRECLGASSASSGMRRFEDAGSSDTLDKIIDEVDDVCRFEEEAKTLLVSWNAHVLRLMDDFGVKTEGELVSGQVSSFGAHHRARIRGRGEHFALLMQLNRQTRELRSEFREVFWGDEDENLGSPGGTITPEATQKACAWYKACATQVKKDRREGRLAILSFPWCVSDVLRNLFAPKLPPVGEWYATD